MPHKLDRYSSEAEALPVFLAFLPLAALVSAIMPEGFTFQGVLLKVAPFIGSAGLAFVASQIGADFGKRKESELWAKWGGPPTTRFLRYGNQEFNEITRLKTHSNLRALGLNVPTLEEQQADPVLADEHYEACVAELRRLTRQKRDAYPMVHKRLIDYGFRRNLSGLKPIGAALALVVALVASVQIALAIRSDAYDGTTLAVLLTSGVWAIGWFALVGERAVSRAADRYAETLLEAARDLE